jgi:hypothetical protein
MHGRQDGLNLPPFRSQGILNVGRNFGINPAIDQAVLFQFPQALHQGFGTDAGESVQKLMGAAIAPKQLPQDQN